MSVEAPRELDPHAVDSLQLIVSAGLVPVTIADIDEDPRAEVAVDAAAWERLAECLGHLAARGWSFSGPSGDGQTV